MTKTLNNRILVVDDETDILEFLSYNLKKNNFEVYTAKSGEEAINIAKQVLPNLILLDIMMPGMDGIETCEEIRKINQLSQTIIAFLTARGEDYSQIAGFEAGADDYITKPIRPKVLISRISALLKRLPSLATEQTPESTEKSENIIIDKEHYVVFKNNEELILPKKEFELLSLLVAKPGRVFNRDEIFSAVWGDDVIVGDRTIDVHIRKLREKIGEEHIKTIKGVGYKYID